MLTINKVLSRFTWYGPALSLGLAFTNKNRIKRISVLNDGGSGEVSFDTTRGVQSLTQLLPGMIVTVQALGIVPGDASTYFSLDNGTVPASGASGAYQVPLDNSQPVAGETEFYLQDQGYPVAVKLTVAFDTATYPNGPTTAKIAYYSQDTNVLGDFHDLPPAGEVVPAATWFLVKVVHNGQPFNATLTAIAQ